MFYFQNQLKDKKFVELIKLKSIFQHNQINSQCRRKEYGDSVTEMGIWKRWGGTVVGKSGAQYQKKGMQVNGLRREQTKQRVEN